jgi:hypothetical protein
MVVVSDVDDDVDDDDDFSVGNSLIIVFGTSAVLALIFVVAMIYDSFPILIYFSLSDKVVLS